MAETRVYLIEYLKEKLWRIPQVPLTVISAPMGYGKTTVLKEALLQMDAEKKKYHVLWQTLLGGGKEGFWEDFQGIFQTESEELFRFLNSSPMPEQPEELRRFVKMFQEFCRFYETPLIIVMDGMEDETYVLVREFLHFWVKNLPDGVHLVISGRGTAARHDTFYQIYGLANQIGQEDFSYSMKDMEQYYRLNGVVLSRQMLQALHQMCAGWNVLVHMNLREYQERKSFLSEQEMFQFMERVVFSHISPQVFDFLSVMEVADFFSVEKAEYLWGKGDGEKLIKELMEEGLLLTFDRSRNRYQIVPLFARYISWKNERLPEEIRNRYLNRLAEWYLKKDENERARRLYYRIKNFDALMDAVERRRFLVLYGLDEQEFISYYTDCPAEIRARHPKAILTFARQMFAFGHHDMGKEVCAEFEEIMKNSKDMEEETRSRLTGTYELLLCYAQYNDLSAMLPHIYKAKQLLDTRRAAIPWPDTGLNDSLSLLYMYHRKPGDLEQEVRLFSEYNPLYSALIGGRLDGADLVMQAESLYIRGLIQEAEIAVYKALLVIHRDRQWHTWLCVVMLQIRIALAKGNWHTIQHLLREVEDSVSLKGEYRVFPVLDILEIFLYSKLRQPQKIPARLEMNEPSSLILCFRAAPMLYCVQAEALLAKGEYLKLLALSERCLESSRIYPNIYAEIMLHLLLAGTYEALAEGEKAKTQMKQALDLAAPDHILMPFVELGWYISKTMDSLKEEDGSILAEIKRRQGDYIRNTDRILSEHFVKPPMGLTARELEIAQLAAMRLSNREIADKLIISESTVKTQLARVFSKLEIQKRRDLSRFFPEK